MRAKSVAIYAVARALDTDAGIALADWEAANSAAYKARYGT
ncbi:hypothetical protein [Enterovirga rhinocerotis]|nr:hypothetical protein [Enterovirga rhinocerotis]